MILRRHRFTRLRRAQRRRAPIHRSCAQRRVSQRWPFHRAAPPESVPIRGVAPPRPIAIGIPRVECGAPRSTGSSARALPPAPLVSTQTARQFAVDDAIRRTVGTHSSGSGRMGHSSAHELRPVGLKALRPLKGRRTFRCEGGFPIAPATNPLASAGATKGTAHVETWSAALPREDDYHGRRSEMAQFLASRRCASASARSRTWPSRPSRKSTPSAHSATFGVSRTFIPSRISARAMPAEVVGAGVYTRCNYRDPDSRPWCGESRTRRVVSSDRNAGTSSRVHRLERHRGGSPVRRDPRFRERRRVHPLGPGGLRHRQSRSHGHRQ